MRRDTLQVIRIRRRPGCGTEGVLSIDGMTIACVLGRSGITHVKREGDGATPAGRMRLLQVCYRPDRMVRPRVRMSVHRIMPTDGWSDDPKDANYNRAVSVPYGASHERMWRDDRVYDVVGILDWNLRRRALGRGSAIFLHLARDNRSPTEGCIALPLPQMRQLLARLRPGAVFVVD